MCFIAAIRSDVVLRHRHLALRRPPLARALVARSALLHAARRYLQEQENFLEVETPTLHRATSGGAREFLVPSRLCSSPSQNSSPRCYSLCQSPQQFKQLLVMGGVDRYMQVARCYRDEAARPDRQPEFSQLDLEMAFSGQEDVLHLVERLLASVWPQLLSRLAEFGDPRPPKKSVADLQKPLSLASDPPFLRLTHQQCLDRFGSDKPDIRFGMELQSSEESHLQAELQFLVPKELARFSSTEQLRRVLMEDSEISNAGLQVHSTGSGGLAVRGAKRQRSKLGRARLLAAAHLASRGATVYASGLHFLWVVDFPLFEADSSAPNGLASTHHPFTAPNPEDAHLLERTPEQVRSLHYDLVCNGSEVGGGSVRIHDANVQRLVLRLLGIEERELSYFVRALDDGTPPHAGIALGVDRLLTLLLDAPNLRHTIAFPKNKEGIDPMSGAPVATDNPQLALYHLQSI